MARNESADTLPAHDHTVGFQRIQRLAHGALADIVLGGEFILARKHLTRLPASGTDTLDKQRLHLRVQGKVFRMAA